MPPRSVKLAEDETDLRLFPPLRAGWARRGEEAPVPISGGNAKRVLFGALNIETGGRLFLACRQGRGHFPEDVELLFLGRLLLRFFGLRDRGERLGGVAGHRPVTVRDNQAFELLAGMG